MTNAPTGDETTLIDRLATELRDTLAQLPDSTMVLFSAPAPSVDSADARQNLAAAVAEHAGLPPWPEWAAARHGQGHGSHLHGLIHELGEAGKAAVIVVLLAPIEPSLLSHARAVAADVGLGFAVVGDRSAS